MGGVINNCGSPSPCRQPPLVAKRAASLVWWLGSAEVVVGSAAAAIFIAAARMPVTKLISWGQPMPLDELAIAQGRLLPVAMLFALLGTVPGLAYLVLGFPVRSGRRWPIFLALLLVVTQSVALGVALIGGTIQAVRVGQPPLLTLNVLVFGSPIAFLIYTARHLHGAL